VLDKSGTPPTSFRHFGAARISRSPAFFGSSVCPRSKVLNWLTSVDWTSLLVPQTSIAELVIRGTVMYMALFAMLRIVMRRQVGGISTSDILVIVLVAEVSGKGFAPDTRSVVESCLLVMVILFWCYVLEWLQFKFPAFERLTREPKLKLIDQGRLVWRNMAKEFVTREELMAQLREKGLEDCREVKAAYMEADGRISIIEKDRSN
jgi:uncharacterized membrane protein YcaP (DUF421 family)